MTNSLSPSATIENEFYFGDLPGTLQYNIHISDILNLNVENGHDDCGFVFEEQSDENAKRVIPNTNTGNNADFKLILLMKKNTENSTWLKAALFNKNTGKITLMTSTNNPTLLNRPIESQAPEWFIGHYRMSAPMIFWRELINRLK